MTAVKKCCIEECLSCATRKEDVGVTYHKFPKDVALSKIWLQVTHTIDPNTNIQLLVCSRHFRKNDFQIYKDTKYVLKSDAVPSIFPWTPKLKVENNMDYYTEPTNDPNVNIDKSETSLNSSKESEPENLEAIRNYIREQEKAIAKELEAKELSVNKDIPENENVDEMKEHEEKSKEPEEMPKEKSDENAKGKSEDKLEEKKEENATDQKQYKVDDIEVKEEITETLAVASSVMEMIMAQSEATIEKTRSEKPLSKQYLSGNSGMALTVGSKLEAKDYGEYWHPAQIVEVDCDEMEVLVHYENVSKRHDEWISVNSSRLRPFGTVTVEPSTSSIDVTQSVDKIEPKMEERPKLTFVVGERCLAKWRDGRRFVATIRNDLGNGLFEIMFDDGFQWKCNVSRLSKLKETDRDTINVDNNSMYSSPGSFPSATAISTTAPSTPGSPLALQVPIFHTHLFDPARDYLGSKSERREKKRKLNIKEIFNIGQKRKKINNAPTPRKSVKPLIEKEKKIKVENKSLLSTTDDVPVKSERKGIPAAVASIIGTVKSVEFAEFEFKKEIDDNEVSATEDNYENISRDGIKDHIGNDSSELTAKPDLDPVEEEAKLEKFEQEDSGKHEEVIDKIKEAIYKLEYGIHKVENPDPVSHEPKVLNLEIGVTEAKEDPKIVENKMEYPEILKILNEDTIVEENIKVIIDEMVEIKGASIGDDTKKDMKIEAELKEEMRIEPKLKEDMKIEDKITDDMKIENNKTGNTEVVGSIKEDKKNEGEINENLILPSTSTAVDSEKPKKNLSKIKKNKKLRLLQEKKVKKQVEKVKSELEEMKKQVEEMRKAMLMKTADMSPSKGGEMPESFLLPGEWCCKWLNGQPVGTVSQAECDKVDVNNKPALPRRSVQVVDKRLPPGWSKHMIRRCLGNSAGKWDVVLVSPELKRIHTKTDMRNYLEMNADESLKPYEHALYDFGAHIKLSKRMGWYTNTPDGQVSEPTARLPVGLLGTYSPVKRRSLGLKKSGDKVKLKRKKKRPVLPQAMSDIDGTDDNMYQDSSEIPGSDVVQESVSSFTPIIDDGFVYVGSLKVEIFDNLLRCPAEGCLKNFRNNTLLKMHIKHYHKELKKMLGATPKVLDLAYERTRPNQWKTVRLKKEQRTIKVKLPNLPKHRSVNEPTEEKRQEVKSELKVMLTPIRHEREIPQPLDSPKLRSTLNKPIKRPRVLLPVRRPEPEEVDPEIKEELPVVEEEDSYADQISMEPLDFEIAISTHTVTKPSQKQKKLDKKRKYFASIPKGPISEEDEWCEGNSDFDTRSSFPRSGTPDSKMDIKMDSSMQPSSESNEEPKNDNLYMYSESGERIKIVHMKREEIINCHCGLREEDGLMVQCELCLCWQHALCHNIQKESEVPEKYTCSICLSPRRGRRSARFLHDQDRLFEGLLPGARPSEPLRRSHELAGNLLRVQDALHAMRVKYYVATKKDHPKLYLWAKEWETGELALIQEKLNSDYSDLNIMIGDIGKENLPLRDGKSVHADVIMPPNDDHMDRVGNSLVSGLLSSPGAGSLDLPLTPSDLEKLAQLHSTTPGAGGVGVGPQPEAAIEDEACRSRLLRHLRRCQALLDARLDTIEAQVAELESQDPSFEDDETAEYFPRTKRTIQMLMRDLDTMEELGLVT